MHRYWKTSPCSQPWRRPRASHRSSPQSWLAVFPIVRSSLHQGIGRIKRQLQLAIFKFLSAIARSSLLHHRSLKCEFQLSPVHRGTQEIEKWHSPKNYPNPTDIQTIPTLPFRRRDLLIRLSLNLLLSSFLPLRLQQVLPRGNSNRQKHQPNHGCKQKLSFGHVVRCRFYFLDLDIRRRRQTQPSRSAADSIPSRSPKSKHPAPRASRFNWQGGACDRWCRGRWERNVDILFAARLHFSRPNTDR